MAGSLSHQTPQEGIGGVAVAELVWIVEGIQQTERSCCNVPVVAGQPVKEGLDESVSIPVGCSCKGISDSRVDLTVVANVLSNDNVENVDEELGNKIRKHEGGLLLEGIAQPGKKPQLPRIPLKDNVREDGELQYVTCQRNRVASSTVQHPKV